MAKKGVADQWANLAVISVSESAANTLTFKKLETGISLFEKVAWVINRLEYYFDFTGTIFNTNEDLLDVAITTSDQITSIAATNQAVVDTMRVVRVDLGTAASGFQVVRPQMRVFTDLPGGGLIVPPNPIYLAAKGTGLASAQTVICRMRYSLQELSPEQYWELVESTRMVSSS